MLLVGLPAVADHGLGTITVAQAAADPCAPLLNAVACENSKAGSPRSEWTVSGAGDATIQGYGVAMSVNVGETEQFKVKTTAAAYRIDIYRLGYYQGLGARKVAAGILPTATLPQTQPACQQFSDTGLVDCGNWAVSASWTVPSTAVSGVYLARLVRTDNSGASIIPFVVRNDASTSDVVFQTSDETWQAYNTYGGNSLYQCTVSCPPGNPEAYKAAFKVSYNRPFNSAADDQDRSWVTYAEIPMIMFMEQNGYDVSYISGLDTGTRGNLLLNHKTFLSVGHDEYWSGQQRTNVENARDHGVNLAFFSGNEVFWRTRWEPSKAGTVTANRTLVAYKDTHFNAPTDPVEWTGSWVDPRYGTATGGGNPQNALTGQLFLVNTGTTDIVVPADYAKLRLWRSTDIANLTGTQSKTLGAGLGTLGYEWDVDADDGFRPAGLIRMSSTTFTAPEVFTDYGSNVAPGTVTHNLTLYKANSGALVFGAGTVQWSWGLNNFTTGGNTDLNMQQATVNLFADMQTQPATPMVGLVLSGPSTDTVAPTSTVTSPAAGSAIADGATITITGTATDTGGGVVAGVEVSTDGGTTWHPATGTTNWSYKWDAAHGYPGTTIKVRASDDSGNVEQPGAGRALGVNCPCSLKGLGATPAVPDSGDTSATEVGAKFTSDVNGTLSGVRFYKATANKGTHIGNVWSSSGALLATATFTGESASGWQTATFSKPLAVTANTSYVVSYFAPQGHYTQDSGYFYPNPSPFPAGSGSVDSPPLHFPRSTSSNPNGFYAYSSSSRFPDSVYQAEYYWVDVIFNPTVAAAPAVSTTAPASNATGVALAAQAAATFNQAVTASSVTFTLKDPTGASVPGATNYTAATNTATFTPTSALAYSTAYTATISGATNATGQTMTAPYSWTFTTVAPPPPPTVTTTTPANNAGNAAIAAPATATFSQAVTAASVTFTLKDPSGASVPGATNYTAATNTATFTPTSALAYSTAYTATISGATNATGQTMASPYSWTFTTVAPPPPPTVSTTTPANNAGNAAVLTTPTAVFNTSVVAASISFTLTDPAGAAVTGSGSYTTATNSATFTPSAALAYSSTYTATVSGATNATGQSMASPYSWTFTTVAAPPPPTVTTTTPANNATGATPATAPTATFSQAVASNSVVFTLKDPAGVSVPGTTSYVAATNTATFTPSAALAFSSSYTATISGATNTTGQTMTSPYSWTFTTSAASVCPCSIFSSTATPSTVNTADGSAVQLGMKFRSDVPGNVTGIRFYKGSSNTGSHTGYLWSGTGSLLGSLTFTNETASGWQQANFTSPVAIAANTTYVVTYYAPNGFYSSNGNYFAAAVDKGPLHALADGTDGGNGVYRYGNAAFPTATWNKTNYWVDVVMTATSLPAPAVTDTLPANNAVGNSSSTTPTATFNQAVTPSSLTFTLKDAAGTTVPGTTSYLTATNTAKFAPSSALAFNTTYTATVSGATNSTGQSMAAPYSWSFTTTAAELCPCSVFSSTEVPDTIADGDPQAVQVGMKFRSDVAGLVTGVRFYKAASNTGVHTGYLWSGTGSLLGSVTFSNETATGWQQASFDTAVPIAANTTYVVSYFAPAGHYSSNGAFFTTAVTNGHLQGLANGTDGPNGVYRYGDSAFPTGSYNSSNYWVDVTMAAG
ncbi:hypothetical protein CVV68_05955 [Arthrobacter livingstonensis]|uniref:DUF4082 domain-containing protein n=2 Tax=Arthrobacter livingstonensis TaxID=670078 RepID=A0A2V5LLV0_9MICC|nr:hypothetical protein CVV68_05955 [Arthrobacter livingstonensis]